MPLAIRGSASTTNSCPTHQKDDVLVAFTQNNSGLNSGWTNLANYSATWAYDTLTCAYRVATDSSTVAPFTSPGTPTRIYAISGAKTSDPIAGSASGTGGPWAWSGSFRTISSVATPRASGTTTGSAAFVLPQGGNESFAYPSITSASNSGLALGTGDYTVECWYNSRTFAVGSNFLFDFGSTGIAVHFAGTQIRVFSLNDVAIFATQNVGWSTNVWQHLAVVRSNGTLTLYINGSPAGSASNTHNLTANVCKIGNWLNSGNGSSGTGWDGYVSNFRVVKGTAVYGSSFTPSGPLTAISGTSLLTCQSPSTITDSSSNALTLTSTNTVFANNNSPFASMNDSIRLTYATGYGAGGNGWNVSPGSNRVGGPNLTTPYEDSYSVFMEGGVGDIKVIYTPGYYGGNIAWATVSINPAPSASGFFAFF